MDVARAQVLIRKIKKAARRNGVFSFRWGCVISTAYHDDEGPVLRLTTQGGESMWLTIELLRSAEKHLFYLMGHTQCFLQAWHMNEDGEIADHLWVMLRHQIFGATSPETLLAMEAQYQAGTTAPVVLLTTIRPRAWPP